MFEAASSRKKDLIIIMIIPQTFKGYEFDGEMNERIKKRHVYIWAI